MEFQIKLHYEISGGKNIEEHKFTGGKTKNHFTACLQESIRWKRYHCLKQRGKHLDMEKPIEEVSKISLALEDMMESDYREKLFLRERGGNYPKWDEISDKKLVNALLSLSKMERQLIFQHVFEERSFKEIALLNGLADEQMKGIYHYSIRKIRRKIGKE